MHRHRERLLSDLGCHDQRIDAEILAGNAIALACNATIAQVLLAHCQPIVNFGAGHARVGAPLLPATQISTGVVTVVHVRVFTITGPGVSTRTLTIFSTVRTITRGFIGSAGTSTAQAAMMAAHNSCWGRVLPRPVTPIDLRAFGWVRLIGQHHRDVPLTDGVVATSSTRSARSAARDRRPGPDGSDGRGAAQRQAGRGPHVLRPRRRRSRPAAESRGLPSGRRPPRNQENKSLQDWHSCHAAG